MTGKATREALEPFAKAADGYAPSVPDSDFARVKWFSVGDLRRARTAYDAIGSEPAIAVPRKIMQAIAEGYNTRGREDRFVIVTNPDFLEDNGGDPDLVFDLSTHTAAVAGPVGEAVAREDYLSDAQARDLFDTEDGDDLPDGRVRVCDGEWVRIPGGYYFDKSAGLLHPETTRPVEERFDFDVHSLKVDLAREIKRAETAEAEVKRLTRENNRLTDAAVDAEAALAETRSALKAHHDWHLAQEEGQDGVGGAEVFAPLPDLVERLTRERDNAIAAAKMLTASHASVRSKLVETRGLIRDAIGLVPLAHQNWHTDARSAVGDAQEAGR